MPKTKFTERSQFRPEPQETKQPSLSTTNPMSPPSPPPATIGKVCGVYVSYPFRAQKCTHRNFASGTFPRALEERYRVALQAEIRARGRWGIGHARSQLRLAKQEVQVDLSALTLEPAPQF
jgi:hypothetical protein